MAEFRIEIADAVFAVRSLFESTRDYCKNYLTEKDADHFIEVVREDLAYEQELLDIEAREEGLKRRKFSDPFLERTAIQRKAAEYLLGRDVVLFHGSGLALNGEGFLFTAACGTGKSTHARFWRERLGAVAVNDDKPFLKIAPEGVTMYGSPWSGKHGLDSNMAVPLKGLCVLVRGQENAIRSMTPEEALAELLHQGCAPGEEGEMVRYEVLIRRLGETVPLWRMECTKDPCAADIAYAAMGNTAKQKQDRR